MSCAEKLVAYLQAEGIETHTQHHAPAATAQAVAASEHIPGRMMAKVVVVFADGQPALLVLPATHHADLERAGAALGAQVGRLAHEDELATLFPDCDVGAMPPFGNLYDLPVCVDQALAAEPYIVFQAGRRDLTMSAAYADFARLVQPTVAAFAYEIGEPTAPQA
jgi:Ala-tRNA(Pro) deacylase